MLPEEITKFIGKASGRAGISHVEKGAIMRFADAVGDHNPLYYDEEYAKNSRYGSVIAPPGFLGWPARGIRGGTFASQNVEGGPDLAKAGYPRIIDGGYEYEFFLPVRAGDILASSSMTKDIVEREGKTGKMAFVITESTYTNQNGDLVAKARHTMIHR